MNTIHYFVDCETSGYFPKSNALLEVCIVKMVNRIETDRYYAKIHPHPADKIEQGALEKNGLKPSKWDKDEALDPVVAANQIARFIQIPSKESGDKCYLVAHNADFDARWIKGHCFKHKVKISVPYSKIDTLHLARAILIPFGIENCKMDTIRAFLGMSMDGAHTAEKDCRDLIWLYSLLVPPPRDSTEGIALAWTGNIAYLAQRIRGK